MKDQDLPRFTTQLLGLFEIYTPDKKALSDTRIEAYFNYFTIRGWTIEQFCTACVNIHDNKTFSTFPTPAELREALVTDAEIIQAWEISRRAVSRWGKAMSVKFQNPVITSVIEAMGGWQTFCDTKEGRNLTWARKSFEEMYRELIFAPEHPVYLRGLYDNEENMVEITASGDRQIAREEAVLIVSERQTGIMGTDKDVKQLTQGIGE